MAHHEQNFKNHTRWVPAYHFIAGPILIVNAGWRLWGLLGGVSFDAVLDALAAVALVIIALTSRIFPLRAQDRVIRLEMRLRMRELLPQDLQGRINEFTPLQMVGLRFAGDAELPGLARKVLDENMTNATEIKKLVTDWQGDYYRV